MCRSPKIALIACLLFAAAAAAGCRSRSPHPGASFSHQVDELEWSVKTIVDQSDWWRSLSNDVGVLADPEFGEFGSSLHMLGW